MVESGREVKRLTVVCAVCKAEIVSLPQSEVTASMSQSTMDGKLIESFFHISWSLNSSPVGGLELANLVLASNVIGLAGGNHSPYGVPRSHCASGSYHAEIIVSVD